MKPHAVKWCNQRRNGEGRRMRSTLGWVDGERERGEAVGGEVDVEDLDGAEGEGAASRAATLRAGRPS
jgi:hypothetical protein